MLKQSALFSLLLVACGPKTETNSSTSTSSIVGWHQVEGMLGACYYPPNYEKLDSLLVRKQARADALDAMISQWNGSRNDGVSLNAEAVEDAENVLLGHSDDIEAVSLKNLKYCQTAMDPTATSSGWEGWLKRLPSELTAGECLTPIRDQFFHYLELGQHWFWELPICSGNVVEIKATASDRYRISEKGDWINVEGHADLSTVLDTSFPCNETGCVAGQLVGRFQGSAGYEEYFPVGLGVTFKAPMDGTLSVGINDNTLYDNTWYKSGGVVDHTGITIGPVD